MAKNNTKINAARRQDLNLYDDFLAHATLDRLQKILARYKLVELVKEVPGDIVECGVFKGSGIYTFAKINHILMPNTARKIIGFDFFEAPRDTELTRKQDKQILDIHEKSWAPQATILDNLSSLGIKNVELVAGDVATTTHEYVAKNPGFRIAMLYLDVDNYEGTLNILKNLYPLITPGGIVVFDEYAIHQHGESDAVSEYFRGQNPKLQSFVWANTPTAYIIKEKF